MLITCYFCLPVCSNGGDCHLGTAHSYTTQGRYLFCIPQMLSTSVYRMLKPESRPDFCLPRLSVFLSLSHPPSLHSLSFPSPLDHVLSTQFLREKTKHRNYHRTFLLHDSLPHPVCNVQAGVNHTFITGITQSTQTAKSVC